MSRAVRAAAQERLADSEWLVPFLARAQAFWMRVPELGRDRNYVALLVEYLARAKIFSYCALGV